MASAAEKEDLDDSFSSGDVIIEHWGDGDSHDVICVDSSNEDAAIDDPVKINPVMDDSDSDDCCIILEKEVTLDEQKEAVFVPSSLDCESFEDFNKETDELITSTPTHGQEGVAEQESHTTVVGESSEEDEDDTDDSDDNLVIIDEVTSEHDFQDGFRAKTTVNEVEVDKRHVFHEEAPKTFQNIAVTEAIKLGDIVHDTALMVTEVSENQSEMNAEVCDSEEERDHSILSGRKEILKDVETGCNENKDDVKKVESVNCASRAGDGSSKNNISVRRAPEPVVSVPFATETHGAASVPKKADEFASVLVTKKAHEPAFVPVLKKANDPASVPVSKKAHEPAPVPVPIKAHEPLSVPVPKKVHEPASVPDHEKAHEPALVPVFKNAHEPALVPVPKKVHEPGPIQDHNKGHEPAPVLIKANDPTSVPAPKETHEPALVPVPTKAHEPASVPVPKKVHDPASFPDHEKAHEPVPIFKNALEPASVPVPKKVHEPGPIPDHNKGQEPAPVLIKAHEPTSVPSPKKTHQPALVPATKKACAPATVPFPKKAHESASVQVPKKASAHAPAIIKAVKSAHVPALVPAANKALGLVSDPVGTKALLSSVPVPKKVDKPSSVPVPKKVQEPDPAAKKAKPVAKVAHEPTSFPASKRAHVPASEPAIKKTKIVSNAVDKKAAAVMFPTKVHQLASVPVDKKTHESALIPAANKVHEPPSVPVVRKTHEPAIAPISKKLDSYGSSQAVKRAHEPEAGPPDNKRTPTTCSVLTAKRGHDPEPVPAGKRTHEPESVSTDAHDQVLTAKGSHEPVPVATRAHRTDSVPAAKSNKVDERASVLPSKRALEPAASVTTSMKAEEPDLVPVVRRGGFVFGSTAVLDSEAVSVPVREEVSASEQLAMSSEEEQENMEEEEGDGEFWLKMITGGGTGSVGETGEGQSEAWSVEEEKGGTSGGKRKRDTVVRIGKDNDDGEDTDDDKISLAPSEEMFSDENNEVKDENNNKDEDVDDSDDDLHLAIYSLGNYCKRMVRGVLCSKPKCSWVHYMHPTDALTQFYRICSNRSVRAVFRFYRFFTNLEVQEQMVVEAQEMLNRTDPGEIIDVDAKQVCRDVFKAMVKVSKGLGLSLDQYMEMVDISSSLYTIKDGKEILVSLFHQTRVLLADAGPHPAAPRLLRWSWTSLYLDSLSNGVVLSAQFYSDICTLLSSLKMIPQLVVVMLYTALVPSLSIPLVPLAEVLTSPPSVLTTPHSTATVTAQTLSRLCSSEWVALSKLGKIQPGITLLVNTLKTDHPAEVHKFFDSLPELPGLEIPSLPPPPQTQLDFWVRQQLAGGKWEEVAYHFCSIDQQEVEAISDMAEKVLLELSQLCGEFKLEEPIPAVYASMLPVVMSRECEVHTQFFRQLGVALMMCAVIGTQWGEAGTLVKLLANNPLNTDFMAVKPPALSQFSSLDRGVVPLFVLEVLVWTRQRIELVKYLELWDCLASMETELEQEKNVVMISVLECLAAGNTDLATVDIMIRISDVMVPGMRTETDVVLRRRQEGMSNILFQLMLNENMSGSRLWSRYLMVRSCNHQLHKAETRGIVFMLSNSRLHDQAREVYLAAVKWGVYSVQATSRPFTLRLASNMALDEIYVIVMEFLAKVEAEQHQSMNIFVKIEVTSPPNTGIKHINCIRSSKDEAMSRVEHVLKMLEPPLELTKASVPYVREDLVRRYLVLKQQNS